MFKDFISDKEAEEAQKGGDRYKKSAVQPEAEARRFSRIFSLP
jgi:hypothetical protein